MTYSPVPGASITTPFNRQGPLWASGRHTGVDYAAPSGSIIRAVAPGTVVSTGWGGAYGNLVKVRHDDGSLGYYAHMSRIGVRVGQRVHQGLWLGNVGATGNATGPHLHFEVRRNGRSVNPLGWLQADYRVSSLAGAGMLAGAGRHTESVEFRDPDDILPPEPEPPRIPAPATQGGGFPGTEFDLEEQLETELPAEPEEIS